MLISPGARPKKRSVLQQQNDFNQQKYGCLRQPWGAGLGTFQIQHHQHQDQTMAMHACFIHSITQALRIIRSRAALAVLQTVTWEVGVGITWVCLKMGYTLWKTFT